MESLKSLKVKIFADGANLQVIRELSQNPWIKGFTTNPTLMHKAGIKDYPSFAKDMLSVVGDRPVSFEVFSDEFQEMEKQAMEIASWGQNVYVKIPITNTKSEFSGELIKRLSKAGVQLNVTALLTNEQVKKTLSSLSPNTKNFVSVFAGRIADTGRDPVPMMREAVQLMQTHPKAELIWASPRELLNIYHADSIGCHVITVTHDVLAKLSLIEKDLDQYSLETVKMFYNDAMSAGFRIETSPSASHKSQ